MRIVREWGMPALAVVAILVAALTVYVLYAPAPQSQYQGAEPFRVVDCVVTPTSDLFHLMQVAQKLYVIENEKGERYPFYTGDPYWPEQKLGSLKGHVFLNGMFVSVKVGEYLQSPEAEEEARKWCAAWSEHCRQQHLKLGQSPFIELIRNALTQR